MKIITTNIFPPIPLRQFDWSAVTDNYEPGHPVGYGETKQAAIDDLLDQLEDIKFFAASICEVEDGQFLIGALLRDERENGR